MPSLVPVQARSDILPVLRGTPVERLLREAASRHFDEYATRYEIGDPVQFIVAEAARIQSYYPRLMVAPLLYTVEDDRLTQITGR
jgi:hypothetical protein